MAKKVVKKAVLKQVHKDRLLKLADTLMVVPSERFDMDQWVRDGDEEDWSLGACGTAGCAVGWATLIPEFRLAGFRFDGAGPEFQNETSWAAVASFFGTPFSETEDGEADLKSDAIRLFGRDAYANKNDPKAVARRIRQYVANH